MVGNPSGFVVQRGINLSHWLSQDFGWAPRDEFLKRDDVDRLARLGFDHVRLPIDEKELWHPDGEPNEVEFDRLLRAVGWCREAGLRVVVDLHTVASHHFNALNEGGAITLWTDERAQDRFVGLWTELSARLGHLPVGDVAYEFLNEPVADDAEDWNALVRRAHAAVREREPGRVLVLGPNRWQQPDNLPALWVPAGDPNVILGIHTYAPLLFTHHRAYWVSFRDFEGAVRYPGPSAVNPAELAALQTNAPAQVLRETGDARDDWSPERMRLLFEPAIERARECGLQLYCDEFGCLPTVGREDRLAYYRDITAVMRAAGMAWAAWEWKGDFGIFTWRGPEDLRTPLDTELVDILVAR
jgi:endoglucanase